MHAHLETVGRTDCIPPQRNLPDLSSVEAHNPQDDGIVSLGHLPIPFSVSLSATVLPRSINRWVKFPKDPPERGTCVVGRCLWHLHTCLPLHLDSILHLNAHSTRGLRGSRLRWERGAQEQGKHTSMQPPTPSPKGLWGPLVGFTVLYISSQLNIL